MAGLLVIGLVLPALSEGEAAPSESPGSLEFVGKNLFGRANGVFHEWRVVDFELELDSPGDGFAVVEVALASVDTENKRRDDHLRTPDFFDVERFPTATARGHSLVEAGESEAGNPLYDAQFDIDLHGIEKTVSGVVEIVSRDPLVAEGQLVLDRLEFEIGPAASRWNPMSIDPEIPIHFRVEF